MVRGDSGLMFKALSPALTESIEDSDIQRLRERIEAWFQAAALKRSGLVWEDWIEIVVQGYDRSHENEVVVSLDIKRNILKRAVMPTGEAVELRTTNGHSYVRPFPKPKRSGEEDEPEGTGIFKGVNCRDTNHEYAYVPATQENLAAITAIQQGLVAVRQKVSDFMHKANNAGAIQNINGSIALLSDAAS
jgi:hypothetical protein